LHLSGTCATLRGVPAPPPVVVLPPAPAPPGSDAPLIVLSPHFDDAVLACGGIVAAARARGRRVSVVTFFTEAPPGARIPRYLRAFADHGRRRAEDDRALALLGAEGVRLGFVERVFRDPPLGPGGAFRLPVGGLAGFQNLPAMIAAVRTLLARTPGARVLAPFGIGQHTDHVEVFLAALHLLLESAAPSPILFYEDAYALLASTRARHFATQRLPHPDPRFPEPGALHAALFGKLLGWATSGPPLRSILPPAALSLGWRVEPVAMAAYEAQKLGAVRAYASQLGAFGGAGWLRALRRHHAAWGGAEPLWGAVS
jgi:LmbE family N-acetylglucosaminyl deacetylase